MRFQLQLLSITLPEVSTVADLHLYATDANVFKPTGGVTEFTGNDPRLLYTLQQWQLV